MQPSAADARGKRSNVNEPLLGYVGTERQFSSHNDTSFVFHDWIDSDCCCYEVSFFGKTIGMSSPPMKLNLPELFHDWMMMTFQIKAQTKCQHFISILLASFCQKSQKKILITMAIRQQAN